MSAVPESKAGAGSRRKPAQQLSFGQTQQLMIELPAMLQGMQEQSGVLQKLMSKQLNLMKNQSGVVDQQLELMNRMYDRMDALTVEMRVSNVLLAELVATHQTIVTDVPCGESDKVRNDAYTKVLSGQ